MSIFSSLSYKSRKRKLELFYEKFNPAENTQILDIGAEVNIDGDRGLQLIDSYRWKGKLSALNISESHIEHVKKNYPMIDAVVGDACKLPWPDKHFDVVYSNAVIEHVGDYNRQKQMAKEIIRVAKNWFVTTPNKRYPFEFHLRLPFVTWLPGNTYLKVGNIISYNHVKKKYTLGNKCEGLRLLTPKEFSACFPSSNMIKQQITFMPETLVAIGGEVFTKK